ncbi:hypothetical protein [Segeticoccus rhizosphaerae]|uniref:hypothetical protein n=1 Tax=Segeticoccus rhizosphaerae TaxID=1104777 RepID=UPI001264EFD2|nr:hypothetical protein [Segeticoccus rhizosphaerae]
MATPLPRRILHDWHPDGPLTEQEWLEQERVAGWVPDPLHGAGSVPVEINGKQLRRYAMIGAAPVD